jgi:hypothetical protein
MRISRSVAQTNVMSFLLLLCVGQLSFSMNEDYSQESPFLKLPTEVQYRIFGYSNNKNNFKKVNKQWNIEGSIQSPVLFTPDFCKANNKYIQHILLNAAYVGNYDGVENILQNDFFLEHVESRLPYHHIDICKGKGIVLDLWGMAAYKKDKKLSKLLETYKIPAFEPHQTICNPTVFAMSCFAGNSDEVKNYLLNGDVKDEIGIALKIAIDCDYVQCINIFLEYIEQNVDLVSLLDKKLLERACMEKNIKALKVLLDSGRFDLTETTAYCSSDYILTEYTLLDKIKILAQEDPQFNKVENVLKDFGTETFTKKEEKIEKTYSFYPCLRIVIIPLSILLGAYFLKRMLSRAR